MNTILLWAMGVTAFIVTIMGGVLLAVLLFYGMFRLIGASGESGRFPDVIGANTESKKGR